VAGAFASARYIDTSCRCCQLHAFNFSSSASLLLLPPPLIKSKFRAAGINQASKWRLGYKIYIPVPGAQTNAMPGGLEIREVLMTAGLVC